MSCVHEDLEQRLAATRERVRELGCDFGRETMGAWRAALDDQLAAERELAAARGEQYAQVIDIGPDWDTGAPLPHLISNGSRAFVVCRASQPDPDWDGTYTTVVSHADAHPSLFTVIELRGARRSGSVARTTRQSAGTRCTARDRLGLRFDAW